MNLSTSSFRTELKVIAVVLLLLACVEGGLRIFENKLSLDIVNIKSLPEVAQRLAQGVGTKVLFFGNSRTRHGVDTEVIEKEFAEAKLPVTLERSFPDETGIVDWYYIFNHYFVDTNSLPDVLVVGFAGSNLADAPIRGEQPRRIGRYFSSLSDIPTLFRYDLTTTGQRAEYLLSHSLVSFANRERVRKRSLSLIIPGYQALATTLNTTPSPSDERSEAVVSEATESGATVTYERLQRFIALAQSHQVKLVFVAMPEQDAYSLDDDLLELFSKQGTAFIDARTISGLGESDFVDAIHLNESGAKKYSSFITPYLVELVKNQ